MEKESKNIYNKKQSALRMNIKDASAYSASNGISNAYITPFILKLSANELFIGILSALTGIVAPISQIFGSSLMKKYERKSIVIHAVFWQAILWLPLSILAIFKYLNIFQDALIYIFIATYTLIVALSGIAVPAWFSWIGDLISEKHKGRFFAKRYTYMGIFEMVAVIVGGIILKTTENTAFALLSFSAIFFLSFIFRLVSLIYIKKMYIDKSAKLVKSHNAIINLLSHHKAFKMFSIYNLFLHFSIFFASPFFAVYMLKELNFNYILYMAVALSGGVNYLIFNKMIGRFSDRYGNIKLLILSNICFALNPLIWTISQSPIYLILVPGLFTGIANSAMIISLNNFTLDALSKKERGDGIAFLNLFAGIGVFIGSILGGLFLKLDFNILSLNNFIILFLIAFALRALVAFIFIPRIKEVKHVKTLPSMHISLLHPFKSIHSEILWAKHVFK